MQSLLGRAIKITAQKYPAVIPLLGNWARYIVAAPIAYKTYDYFLSELTRMIRNVYNGNMGGDFIDIMASLIQGQINQAYRFAWRDSELAGEMPEYLTASAEEMILNQYDYVDGLYRDIVDARVDKTPIDPLLARAPLWANRWNEAYGTAQHLIVMEMGGKEEWVLGATETHCPTCAGLNGIVAYAREWEGLGVRPQAAPNPLLNCEGWRCDCERKPSDKRRSPKAYDTILNVITSTQK